MFVSFCVFACVFLRVRVCLCVVRVRVRVHVVLYYFRSTAVDSGMYVCIRACVRGLLRLHHIMSVDQV